MLDIYAGKKAIKIIEEKGFKQELFTHFLGASGGPKWFVLFGLDKYLFGEFFKDRKTRLNLLGSSAGSFRASCFAQEDPVAAISRMAESYATTVYSKKAKPDEITTKAIELLDIVLAGNAVDEIINNKTIKAHFLVNKVNGLVASEKLPVQFIGLLKSMLANRIDRKLIRSQYERVVFSTPNSKLTISDDSEFTTHFVSLSQNNLREALLASGSIPMVMQGVKNITGAPKGVYRDGGIIDYHFDINITNNDELVLYPHFNAQPKAGWFDKNLKRKVDVRNYENTVMLVPSQEFIHSLPFQKISDRKDFTNMEPQQRIKYWQTVLSESSRLSDELQNFIQSPDLSKIKRL